MENLAKEKGFSKSAILALALENYSRKELEQNKRKLGLGKTIVSAKHCCSIKVILPLWQKTNQDTSPFLLYPESIPEDWKSKLELIGVPIAISPFHDMDEKLINQNGHLMMSYEMASTIKSRIIMLSMWLKIQLLLIVFGTRLNSF